ncbi:MAG: serine hydrolase domain-containing protein [Acidimicrobiales bacterium]
MALPAGVDGSCEPAFAAVAEVLAQQLASGVQRGAAVAVRHRGRPVVDIWGGGFAEDTLVVCFSTTKGIAATAVHMVVERAGLDYDAPVASVWPEFGRHGKDAITIRQCLCHEAGVPQIRDQIPDTWAMADWEAMVAMVENLTPLWPPGTANGYHAINWGWLAGELVRRIDGRPLPQFLAEEVAGPLGLDGCSIGTPMYQRHRLATVALDPAVGGMPAFEDFLPADSITVRSLTPRGSIVEFVNSPAGLDACAPAINGAFTARSLASVYALLERGGSLGDTTLLRPSTVIAATAVQNHRPDLVLILPMRWRLGFMGGGVPRLGPSSDGGASLARSFGHAGFGGSIAMADPASGIAMAVTLDHLSLDIVGDDRSRRLVATAVACAEAADG